jgi:hypothetical protein
LVQNGAARIEWYIHHRQEREKQVINALEQGYRTANDIVTAVYPGNLRRNLREAAARNVRTHLEKLVEDGQALEDAATYQLKRGY